jgi:hypothetical protein
VSAAAAHFRATHVLALRAGACLLPGTLPAMALAPVSGASVLRQLVRMRVLSSREAGREEKSGDLMDMAAREGIVLAGYPLGPGLVRGLDQAQPGEAKALSTGGPGLWLRAEAGEDAGQSERLATAVAAEMA